MALIEPKQPSGDPHPGNARHYRRVFVGRVHQVLQAGYLRLDRARYAAEEETAITGDLKREMRAYLRDSAAPAWADNFFVQEEEPINDGVRRGKSRNRADIGFEASTPRPGASFSFEAKRLGRGCPVGKYVGPQGLGCIVRGDYAREDDDAGMIGYVQNDDAAYWESEIRGTLEANAALHEVEGTEWWRRHNFPGGPRHVFVSAHARKAVGRPVEVYHSLLAFTATE